MSSKTRILFLNNKDLKLHFEKRKHSYCSEDLGIFFGNLLRLFLVFVSSDTCYYIKLGLQLLLFDVRVANNCLRPNNALWRRSVPPTCFLLKKRSIRFLIELFSKSHFNFFNVNSLHQYLTRFYQTYHQLNFFDILYKLMKT